MYKHFSALDMHSDYFVGHSRTIYPMNYNKWSISHYINILDYARNCSLQAEKENKNNWLEIRKKKEIKERKKETKSKRVMPICYLQNGKIKLWMNYLKEVYKNVLWNYITNILLVKITL